MCDLRRVCVSALLCALALSGCAEFPGLPNDSQLPVPEILEHTACELRAALRSDWLKQHPNFHPDQWSVAISLSPQIDTDFNVNAGTGFKTNDSPPITHILSWVVGPGSGLGYDVKGHNEGSTGYLLHTGRLLKTRVSETCETLERNASLAHHIGIQEWLEESVPLGVISADITATNKLSFNTWVLFKFNGTGAGVTWTVPRGSAYGSIGGSYQTQYTLGLQFTPDPPPPPPLVVVTLPDDGHAPSQRLSELRQQSRVTRAVPREPGSMAGVSAPAQDRLNILQLEQAIKNIRIPSQ